MKMNSPISTTLRWTVFIWGLCVILLAFLWLRSRGADDGRGIPVAKREVSQPSSDDPRRKRPSPSPTPETRDSQWADSQPAASKIRIEFRDEADTPCEGIAVGIVREARRLEATSGADGVVTFGVKPGRYRWRNLSTKSCRIEPVPDVVAAQEIERSDTSVGWIVDGAVGDSTISGAFDVAPGQEVEFRILVYTRNRITGMIDPGSEKVQLFVSAIERRRHSRGSGNDLVVHRRERDVSVGASGIFEVTGLSPGEKAIEGWWRRGDEYHFAGRTVVLDEGASIDVGYVGARERFGVDVLFGFRRSGAVVDASEVLESFEPNSGAVDIRVMRVDSIHDDDLVAAHISLPIERSCRLNLPPGKTIFMPITSDLRRRPDMDFDPPRQIERVVGSGEKVEWLVDLHESPVSARIAIELSPNESPHDIVVFGKLEGRSVVKKWSIEARSFTDGRASIADRLTPGRWRLLATDQQIESDTRVPHNSCGEQIVEIVDGSEVTVRLSEGVELVGVAKTRSGSPYVGPIRIAPESWTPVWPYSTMTDSMGRFRFVGLLRGTRWIVDSSDPLPPVENLASVEIVMPFSLK